MKKRTLRSSGIVFVLAAILLLGCIHILDAAAYWTDLRRIDAAVEFHHAVEVDVIEKEELEEQEEIPAEIDIGL